MKKANYFVFLLKIIQYFLIWLKAADLNSQQKKIVLKNKNNSLNSYLNT